MELNRRSNLDTKLNITIAFCGVIFLFILKYLDFKPLIEECELRNCLEILIRIVYSLGCLFIIIMFSYSLIKLFTLLKTIQFLHVDVDKLLNNNMVNLEEDKAKMYLSALYIRAINNNSSINTERNKIYNKAVAALSIMIFLCVVVEFIKINFM